MRIAVRIFTLLWLAVFAAGTIVHAGTTANMSAKMSFGEASDNSTPDCGGCDSDSKGSIVCYDLCVIPLVLFPPAEGMALFFHSAQTFPHFAYELVGRTGPPEMRPPRTIS